MNIYRSFLKYVIASTYCGVFFLRIFHYGFIYRRPENIILGCIPTVVITAFLILVVCICEYRILSPFEALVNRAKRNGEKMSDEDAVACIEAYKKFDVAIAVGEGIGFFLGSGSTSVVEALTGYEKFNPLLFFIIVAQSVGVGFICYTLVVFRIKRLLMTQALHDVGVSVPNDLSRTLSVAITASVYISIFNMMTVPIGLLTGRVSGNLFSIFIRDCIIGGLLTGTVCYVTYSLLVKKIRETEKNIGKKLYLETMNLAVATKESAATSVDQSAAIKEIVSTIEDTKNLSMNIKEKLKNVSDISEKSKEDIRIGVEYLDRNIKELFSVMETNKQTIEGIKDLGGKIDNIWDVVSLINEIASQAKIIAFNAELEASSAGEYGKNFHIVATEVRRLSDNIIDGTKEIKEKITEVQGASDSLILVSEQGAEKIASGYDSIKSLQGQFSSIKKSSEDTAKSSSDMTDFVIQLSASHEQIYSTIKQIAVGIENFSQTTESISSASQNVKDIAKLL
ncbi:MAG: hypothetical protein IJ828_10480 [Treponema sp.]|nr:hypothetical protein [Treponema sp.]